MIYQPTTDELYACRRGGGATLNGRPIRVSGLTDARQAMIEAGWSTRLPSASYIALVDRLYRAGAQVRRAGSGTLGLAYVADGRTDAYCELHINSWDALAGLLLIEEAGGYVNDFLADDGLRRGNAVLGCTPALRDLLARRWGCPRGVDADCGTRWTWRKNTPGRRPMFTIRCRTAVLGLLAIACLVPPACGPCPRLAGALLLVQEEWCRPMVTTFERETGIKVSMTRKSSGEFYAQLKAEAANPRGDIWWGGTGDPHLQAAEEGLTIEYKSP